MAVRPQVLGDLLGRGDGERVDDPGPVERVQVLREPGQPLLRALEPQHGEVQGLAVQGPAQDEYVGAQLLGDVPGDPRVGGGGRREHRDARRQRGEHLPDASVVGPEVVPPVGDAVRLVDDEEAGRLGQLGKDLVAERRVVQPLRADQQYVDLTRVDLRADGLPVLDVGGVDGGRADACSLGRLDLVAHQREQRRDDHGRPGTELAQQRGGDEVDRRLPPAGLLYDEHAALLDHQRLDRRPLVVVQACVVAADQRTEVLLGLVPGARGRGHGFCLPRRPDMFTGRSPGGHLAGRASYAGGGQDARGEGAGTWLQLLDREE